VKVPFYRHSLADEDVASVVAALADPVLTRGARVVELERRLAELTGNEHVVGLMSGTHALELALRVHGVGPGDEVITTPLTFVATSNVVLHCGARPVFVDVEPATGNIDPALVEAAVTPRTRALLVVDLYGTMCDMRALRAIADRRGLTLIEDAAHCLEGERDGVRPGNLAHAGCFSFYATKNVTSGEGGAIAVHDGELAERLVSLSMHGMSRPAEKRFEGRYQHWDVAEPGYKANMSNLQAALLLPQLARVEAQWRRREAICQSYERAFGAMEGVGFPVVPEGARSGRHLFTIWVPPEERDRTIAALEEEGIGVTVNYRAVHLLAYYREALGLRRGMFPVAERIGDATVSLPLYPRLTDAEIEHVIGAVRRARDAWAR
jgi:UDP-4-amino-4-deoxy-L-arabinose-oxoglutarate aminotransferase